MCGTDARSHEMSSLFVYRFKETSFGLNSFQSNETSFCPKTQLSVVIRNSMVIYLSFVAILIPALTGDEGEPPSCSATHWQPAHHWPCPPLIHQHPSGQGCPKIKQGFSGGPFWAETRASEGGAPIFQRQKRLSCSFPHQAAQQHDGWQGPFSGCPLSLRCSPTRWHCSPKGPYFRDRVPIGTFFTFWVPIGSLFMYQGPYFQYFG